MKKHAFYVWPVVAALACNNAPTENKAADTVAIAATPVAVTNNTSMPDTFAAGGRTYYVVPLAASPFPEEKQSEGGAADSLEQVVLKQDTAVKRMGDSLLLPVENGERVALVNNKSDGDDYADYTYDAFLPEINCYGIWGGYYEASDYVLVNRTTGVSLHVWGKPVISPDKKMLVCPSFDIEAGFIPNGMQLFVHDNGKLENIGDVALDKWGPNRVMWLDNGVIAVEQKWNKLDASGGIAGEMVGAAKIRIR